MLVRIETVKSVTGTDRKLIVATIGRAYGPTSSTVTLGRGSRRSVGRWLAAMTVSDLAVITEAVTEYHSGMAMQPWGIEPTAMGSGQRRDAVAAGYYPLLRPFWIVGEK